MKLTLLRDPLIGVVKACNRTLSTRAADVIEHKVLSIKFNLIEHPDILVFSARGQYNAFVSRVKCVEEAERKDEDDISFDIYLNAGTLLHILTTFTSEKVTFEVGNTLVTIVGNGTANIRKEVVTKEDYANAFLGFIYEGESRKFDITQSLADEIRLAEIFTISNPSVGEEYFGGICVSKENIMACNRYSGIIRNIPPDINIPTKVNIDPILFEMLSSVKGEGVLSIDEKNPPILKDLGTAIILKKDTDVAESFAMALKYNIDYPDKVIIDTINKCRDSDAMRSISIKTSVLREAMSRIMGFIRENQGDKISVMESVDGKSIVVRTKVRTATAEVDSYTETIEANIEKKGECEEISLIINPVDIVKILSVYTSEEFVIKSASNKVPFFVEEDATLFFGAVYSQ